MPVINQNIEWPEHCMKCPYIGVTSGDYSCDYAYYTGKTRAREKVSVHDCQHYADKKVKIASADHAVAIAVQEAAMEKKRLQKKKKAKAPNAESHKKAEEVRRQKEFIRNEAKRLRQAQIKAEWDKRYEIMQTMYDEGRSDLDIAKSLNISEYRVQMWRREQGLPNQYAAALEKRQEEMYKLWKSGATDRQIAAHFGLKMSSTKAWRERHHLLVNKERVRKNES